MVTKPEIPTPTTNTKSGGTMMLYAEKAVQAAKTVGMKNVAAKRPTQSGRECTALPIGGITSALSGRRSRPLQQKVEPLFESAAHSRLQDI
jgi:hypothetical protein